VLIHRDRWRFLLKDLELIHIAESLADEILDEARFRAENIRKETTVKQAQVYATVYDALITAAKRDAKNEVTQARAAAEKEANAILRQAEERVAVIKDTARVNFETAVDTVVAEILG